MNANREIIKLRKDLITAILFIVTLMLLAIAVYSEGAVEQTTKIKTTWKANPAEENVTEYRLFMSDTSGVYDFNVPLFSAPGNVTTYTKADVPVNDKTTYYFVLCAVNNIGISGPSNELSKYIMFPSTPELENITISLTFTVGQ